jgi:hypothetical protein
MKLEDCDCGGIPQVTYKINFHKEFVARCPTCGNKTAACESLIEAVVLWNQIYCCDLLKYETEPAQMTC